jgi:hypothetical protein
MTGSLWKLNKICEKHGISEQKISLLLQVVEAGGLNGNVLDEFGYKIMPKLQIVLDDLVEAGFISSNPDKEWKK